MQARASDVNGYYSCDDKFAIPDKATNRKGQERQSLYQIPEPNQTTLGLKCETSPPGYTSYLCFSHKRVSLNMALFLIKWYLMHNITGFLYSFLTF